MAQGGLVDRGHHCRRANQCVFAQVHRGRSRVGLYAAQVEVEPFLPQGAQHHAYGFAFVFKDRPLLDMGFKVGAHRVAADFATAGITNGIQGLGYRHALGVGLGQGFFKGEFFCKDSGAHHARRKPRAFFVGPHHHFQRCPGLDVEVVECAQYFDASQHPVATVEFAAGGLGVDMAAGHHRRQVGIEPRTAGENIAHRVDADRAARFFTPAYKDVPGLTVEVGQGQATHAAFDCGTQLRQFHQRGPKAFSIDGLRALLLKVLYSVHGLFLRQFLVRVDGVAISDRTFDDRCLRVAQAAQAVVNRSAKQRSGKPAVVVEPAEGAAAQ